MKLPLAALALALAACASPREPQASAGPHPLAGTSWEAFEVLRAPVTEHPRPTLVFGADGRATGSTGVNSWNAPATLDGKSVEFGAIVTTRRGAAPDRMALETAFTQALAAARRVDVSRAGLALLGADGAAVARFAPAE